MSVHVCMSLLYKHNSHHDDYFTDMTDTVITKKEHKREVEVRCSAVGDMGKESSAPSESLVNRVRSREDTTMSNFFS